MSMPRENQGVDKLLHDLKRERDELRLQLHLGSMEAKEEWQKLSDRINDLAERFEPVKDAVEESAGDVLESIQLVGTEILSGLKKVRQSLSE
jgi:hypothetical protein